MQTFKRGNFLKTRLYSRNIKLISRTALFTSKKLFSKKPIERPRLYFINEHFQKLGLMGKLVKIATEDLGYKTPTPIQEKMIKLAVRGHSIVASAETGTGKTAAYMLPLVNRLHTDFSEISQDARNSREKGEPFGLILAPTRELVEQLTNYAERLTLPMGFNVISLFGNVSENTQIKKLQENRVDVLISTTGRLLHLLEHSEKPLSLKKVKMFILDECDRLLNMGFLADIKKIYSHLPRPSVEDEDKKKKKLRDRNLQVLMVSATLPPEIHNLMKFVSPIHHLIDTNEDMKIPEGVDHIIYEVSARRKYSLLRYFLLRKKGKISFFQKPILVFVRTIQRAERLVESLTRDGFQAAAVHGDKSVRQRESIVSQFEKGELKILIATDVLARGIDIPLLPYVINYDMPFIPEDYIHRIGRTGRNGATGIAISFVSKQPQVVLVGKQLSEINERHYTKNIETLLGKMIRRSKVPGPWSDDEIPETPVVPDFLKDKVEEKKKELLTNEMDRVKFHSNPTKKMRRIKELEKRGEDLSLRDFKQGRFEDVVKRFAQKSAAKKGVDFIYDPSTGKNVVQLKKG